MRSWSSCRRYWGEGTIRWNEDIQPYRYYGFPANYNHSIFRDIRVREATYLYGCGAFTQLSEEMAFQGELHIGDPWGKVIPRPLTPNRRRPETG